MNRRLRPPVALVIAALVGTGCSHTSGGAGAGNGPAATAGSTRATPLSAHEKGVKFAECMRANGVPHFPDPDPKGDFNLGVDVTREAWLKAVNSCKSLQPPGALSSKRNPKEKAATLRFAQCVRDHGVKDFPDPVNGQPLIDTYKIPSSNKPGGMAILNAAAAKCGNILKQAAGGQG
jgi:hypothetical protein